MKRLLAEPYVADMDNTVKPVYGHQEGAEKGYNPKKPGRPSHNYQTWAMGATRLVLGVDVLPGKRHSGRPDQLLLPTFDEWIESADATRSWDFCVLVSSVEDLDAMALAQLYRDRGDCENIFDELKNQWGWGGFVTRDLARTRFVALLYNLWSIFTRLVSPEAHREAKTSRPALLNVIGRITRSGRTTVLHLVSNHALADRIAVARDSIHNYLRTLRATAGQLGPEGMWKAILRAAFRHFLCGKATCQPPLIGDQWLLPLPEAPS